MYLWSSSGVLSQKSAVELKIQVWCAVNKFKNNTKKGLKGVLNWDSKEV